MITKNLKILNFFFHLKKILKKIQEYIIIIDPTNLFIEKKLIIMVIKESKIGP